MNVLKNSFKLLVIMVIMILILPIYVYGVEPISTTKYIIDSYYITNIYKDETVENFMNNIEINSIERYQVYKDQSLSSLSDKISTGMTLQSESRLYILVVLGDVTGDGNVTALDLSIAMQGVVRLKNIEKEAFKAVDINNDNKLTAIDVSRMQMLITGLVWENKSENNEIGKIVINKSTDLAAKSVKIMINWPKITDELTKQVTINGTIMSSSNINEFDVDENCEITAKILDADYNVKSEEKINITNIDLTPPDSFSYSVILGLNDVTVIASTTDKAEDSKGVSAANGIAKIDRYEYSLDGKEWQKDSRFGSLEKDVEYRIYVKAIDGAGNETMATNNGDVVKVLEMHNHNHDNDNEDEEYYEGFTVLGYIEIPKININLPVLSEISMKAMEKSICRLYGPELNEVGNVVLAGYNYKNSTFVSDIAKLGIGDSINIIDKNGKSVKYVIYEKHQTTPDDSNYVTREVGDKKEITLLTALDDSSQRTVILAREES